MQMFVLWTVEELESAIKDLENGIASGQQSIGYNTGGQVAYIDPGRAKQTLRALYNAWRKAKGMPPDPSMRPKLFRVIPAKGY